jgi:FemAB-related protein (PEP-CTERM system-associated)
MIIEELSQSSASDWDGYVSQHPETTCYHDRAWSRIVEATYGFRSRFLLARESAGGPVRGALPLFEKHGLLRPHLSNGVFGAYASILAEDASGHARLLEAALELKRRLKLQYFLLKTLGPENAAIEDWAHTTIRYDGWVIARLALQKDPDKMWRSLRDKTRNCVRKARRHGLEVRWAPEGVDAFYDVLSENMHSKGAPIYGREFLRTVAKEFGPRARVLTLWKGREIVSGALMLESRGVLYVPFASSRPASLHMSPNNLLYWEIIRRACEDGLHTLDFGRSIKGSGSLAFKLGWNAESRAQPCYIWCKKPSSLDLNPNRRSVEFFLRQWSRMPRTLAEAAGPWLCRQLAGMM